MAENAYFQNQFLVAMPGLEDPNFNHSVALLCEHNDQGALGLIINRPTDLKLADMLEHLQMPHAALDSASPIVYWGGPVQQERGFVVHTGPDQYESTLKVGEKLFITTSRDILNAIGKGEGPADFIVILGYAGWGAGQLEDEVLQNSWLNTPVDRGILFQTPISDRWRGAARLLGVDVTQLSSGPAGHA